MSVIVEQEYIADYPIDKIIEHPENARLHNDEKMDESIDGTGFTGAVLIQKSTGYCIDGNGRVKGLRRKGEAICPVFIIDVDDTMATKILISRNRVPDLSGMDDAKLSDLLSSLADDGDLFGTGYTADDLDDLFASNEEGLTLPEEEFNGDYAETAEQQATRSERKTAVRTAIGLRETLLVFPEEQYQTFMQALAVVANFATTEGASQTVFHAVVQYALQLEADNE